jgi:hypothetical protein
MKKLTRALLATLLPLAATLPAAAADPVPILFVGNSYTFGRVDPVMSYNAANVHDLTAAFNAIDPTGTNSYPVGTPNQGWFEQHPWGGVPGIFKKMTDEAGFNYDVSLSTRNAASLRGQFLNTANPTVWDLRGNVASQKWNTVVLQAQSDEPLPTGKGKNANPLQFTSYANQFESYIHTGTVAGTPVGSTVQYTETQLYGSLAACQSTGRSTSQCNATQTVPNNTNFNAGTKIYLEQTWARPDMVEAHKITTPDKTTANGAPIIDISSAGGNAITYYSNLAGMTTDMHAAFYNLAASKPAGYNGVIPVGDAFQRAVDEGLVLGSGFYQADGTYIEPTDGTINLWWLDRTHASKYGSYLSALTTFGSITGLDPRSLGASEQAAFDLGISVAAAQMLQQVAAEQLGFAVAVPEPASAVTLAAGLLGLAGWVRRRRQAA